MDFDNNMMPIPNDIRITALDTVAGYGVIAEKDFEAGELLFTLQEPMFIALDSKYLPTVCSYCFHANTGSHGSLEGPESEHVNVKACLGCKTLHYCSKQCQAASWNKHHKSECKILKKTATSGTLPSVARAVIQMITSNSMLTRMDSHLDDIAKVGGERYARLQIMSTGIFNYTGTKLSLTYVQQCLAMMQTNSFTLMSATFDPLGIVMDPYAANFNHSCDPNAFVVFDGHEMSFRTLKSIKDGEEIFISYIDVTNPYRRRQQELADRYFFTCRCKKCKRGPSQIEDKFLEAPSGLPQNWDRHMEIAPDALKRFVENDSQDAMNHIGNDTASASLQFQQQLAFDMLNFHRKGISTLAHGEASSLGNSPLKLLKEGLQACLQTKIWPDCRQPIPALRQEIFVELLNPGFDGLSWSYAFRQGLKLYFDIHPILYPENFHPGRIVHKWTLAKLALMLADPETRLTEDLQRVDLGVVIIGLLMEVQSNVKQSHGVDSTFAGIVWRKMEEVIVDMTRGDNSQLRTINQKIGTQWNLLRQISASEELDSWMSLV